MIKHRNGVKRVDSGLLWEGICMEARHVPSGKYMYDDDHVEKPTDECTDDWYLEIPFVQFNFMNRDHSTSAGYFL